MPYFLLVRMIEERNIMNRSWKTKKKGKAMNENDLAGFANIEIERG